MALCLLSDARVAEAAAFDITDSSDLHDPRFGNAGSTEVVCPTCNMRGEICVGHHASLSLGISMFHPFMYKDAQRIINSTCFGCGADLVKVTKSKARRCTACGVVNNGDYVIYANDMSAAVRPDKKTFKLASDIPEGMLPEGYVMSKVLVPPIHLRTPEDMEWSTDIQKLYEQLLQAVRSKGDVCTAYARITGAHKKEGIIGIMSGKDGVFRKLMVGKRVEMSARAVIVGDPHLKMDEVAVPKVVAEFVRVRVACSNHNVDILRAAAAAESLWWESTDDLVDPGNILQGMVFERRIADGDCVMLNRQPTLSKQSLTCFTVVVRKDDQDVFGINPQATPPFNADFDGDEMNIFFMSQTSPHECRAEMTQLCHAVNVVPVQDVATGCYAMSREDSPVSREVWDDCAALCSSAFVVPPRMSTHGILLMCFPGYDGRVLEKGDRLFELAHLDLLQLVVERWLSVRGLTVSLADVTTGRLNRNQNESPDAYRERCLQKVQCDMSGSGLMDMIESGAKGSLTHAAHMAIAIGQQYVGGREGTFCNRSYSRGLTPEEFFGHQMAAREGVVSTGVSTANTGYLNRRACKIMADLKLQYNGTVADDVMLSSF